MTPHPRKLLEEDLQEQAGPPRPYSWDVVSWAPRPAAHPDDPTTKGSLGWPHL